MINLLNNIDREFLRIDKALNAFNSDIKSSLAESFIFQKLNQLNSEISERLKEVKLNMAALEIAIKIQNLDTFDEGSKEKIKDAKTVVEDTLARLIQSKHQLEKLSNSPSSLSSALQALLQNIKEFEFLLTKHLQQYDLIME